MITINPLITAAGLASVMASNNAGLELQLTHIALGDGGAGGSGIGYTPNPSQTALVRERSRFPIAGGERVGPKEIAVQALADTGPSFWVREVGFIAEPNVLFAVWSDPVTPLGYKDAGIPLVLAYYLALEAVPANSVNVTVTGPSVNIILAEPFADMAAEILRLQGRVLKSEIARLTPAIANINL